VKAAVFDYIYVTGSGKSQQTHYQTVVYLEPVNLALPMFSLRPETLFHRMLSAFGYQDIDFGQRPEFSKQYILRGQNELAIRQTFNDRVLSFFRGLCRHLRGRRRQPAFHLSRGPKISAARNRRLRRPRIAGDELAEELTPGSADVPSAMSAQREKPFPVAPIAENMQSPFRQAHKYSCQKQPDRPSQIHRITFAVRNFFYVDRTLRFALNADGDVRAPGNEVHEYHQVQTAKGSQGRRMA
jgi:hypothetical protein